MDSWTDLPQEPKALLTAVAFAVATRWLWPMASAKLEEVRAKAKAAAHDLAKRYATEAVRWAANEGRRLNIAGDELERLALQHLRAIATGVTALGKWTEADLLGVLRDAFEQERAWRKRYESDVDAIAKRSKEALARLEAASKAAEAQNAARAPGGGGDS